jgi:hypothetical protein
MYLLDSFFIIRVIREQTKGRAPPAIELLGKRS